MEPRRVALGFFWAAQVLVFGLLIDGVDDLEEVIRLAYAMAVVWMLGSSPFVLQLIRSLPRMMLLAIVFEVLFVLLHLLCAPSFSYAVFVLALEQGFQLALTSMWVLSNVISAGIRLWDKSQSPPLRPSTQSYSVAGRRFMTGSSHKEFWRRVIGRIKLAMVFVGMKVEIEATRSGPSDEPKP